MIERIFCSYQVCMMSPRMYGCHGEVYDMMNKFIDQCNHFQIHSDAMNWYRKPLNKTTRKDVYAIDPCIILNQGIADINQFLLDYDFDTKHPDTKEDGYYKEGFVHPDVIDFMQGIKDFYNKYMSSL